MSDHARRCLCCYCCEYCERAHGSPCPRGCNAGHLLPSVLLPAAIPGPGHKPAED